MAKNEAFNAKFAELQKKVTEDFHCADPMNANIVGQQSWRNTVQLLESAYKVDFELQYGIYTYYQNPFGGIHSVDSLGHGIFDVAEMKPNFEIGQNPTECHDGSIRYGLVFKMKSAVIHYVGRTKEFIPRAGDKETAWVDGDTLILNFHSRDSAEASGKAMAELIRMAQDIQ